MMFGAFPFGAAPFGAGPEWPMSVPDILLLGTGTLDAIPVDPRLIMLRDTSRPAVHAVSIDMWPLPDGPAVTKRYTDREFVTAADDDPAGKRVTGAFTRSSPLTISRSIQSGRGYAGVVEGSAELRLVNGDGRFDALDDEYAVDGRPVEIRVGREGDRYADMMPVFRGTAQNARITGDALSLKIEDYASRLNIPVGVKTFGGTGGFDGTPDLANKRYPISLGRLPHIPLTRVWPQKNIYVIDSLPPSMLFTWQIGFYVNGRSLAHQHFYMNIDDMANDAYAPDEGKYGVAFGPELEFYVRIGADNDRSKFTSNYWLNRAFDPFSGANTSKARCIYTLCTYVAGFTNDDFDLPAFQAHHAAHGYDIGLHFDENDTSTVRRAIDRICGENTFCGFRRNGKLTIGLIDAPQGGAVVTLDETSIVKGGIERYPMPSGLEPPPWSWRVGYGPNPVNMDGWIAGEVTTLDPGWAAFLAQPIRYARAADPAIQTAHPLAQERDSLDELYSGAHYTSGKAAAEAEAQRLLDLWRRGLRFYKITCDRSGLLAEIGEKVLVKHRRFGLAGGKLMLVVDDHYDAERGLVTLICFG